MKTPIESTSTERFVEMWKSRQLSGSDVEKLLERALQYARSIYRSSVRLIDAKDVEDAVHEAFLGIIEERRKQKKPILEHMFDVIRSVRSHWVERGARSSPMEAAPQLEEPPLTREPYEALEKMMKRAFRADERALQVIDAWFVQEIRLPREIAVATGLPRKVVYKTVDRLKKWLTEKKRNPVKEARGGREKESPASE